MSLATALPTRLVEKPWGQDHLPSPFAARKGARVGEIWFEPPPELSELLIKYLFTSEPLSVQVHPSDEHAPTGSGGKDECWLITSAEPGARLAIGLAETASRERIRAAALDGSIERLLAWHEVQPGDFFYLPAGTVHAIGAGISLIEVQQNSDVTYRLYDYGRPRELHLEEALAVAELARHDPGLRRRLPEHGSINLVEGPCFRLDRIAGPPDARTMARYGDGPVLVVPLDGALTLGPATIAAGGCGLAGSLDQVRLDPMTQALIAQPV